MTKSRVQTEDSTLTPRCRQFIEGIHGNYVTTDIEAAPAPTTYLAYLK